jgi:hypothetical protein
MSKAKALFPSNQTVVKVKKELDKRNIKLTTDKKGGVKVKCNSK